jgi:hypothetical protein
VTRLFFASLLAEMCAAIPSPAANPVCQTILTAFDRNYTTPTHVFVSETAQHNGGKTSSSEMIYVNNMSYVHLSGQWHVNPIMSAQMRQELRQTKEADPNFVCRQVRDESVNGEPATLFTVHHHDENLTTDQQVWISKTRGLPLKQEVDTDAGRVAGKIHEALRYEYTNVQPPAGVH